MFQDFRYSDTTHLSQSVEVLKLKNFKKDATLKLSKSTNQERYEHVGPEVASSQNGKVTRWRRDCAWLMISRCSRSQCQIQVQGTSSILKSMITTTYSQEKVKSLKKSLISVGQLDEEGHHVGFGDQQWKVTKGSLVVARGNKRGSLYMAEVPSDGINAAIDGRGKAALSCVLGKQKKVSFVKSENTRKLKRLELVHTYVYDPTSITSIGGSCYYVTFIDDSSRKVWVYFLKNKSEVFNTFKKWKATVENETNLRVKCLKSDNGGEYSSREFIEYCAENGIRMLKTVPETPQQNDVAERMNRTLNERAKSMRFHAWLPKMFWEDSVKDVARDKLDAKSVKCTFIGYSSDEMGYRFWDSKSHKVVRSRDVTFNEDSIYGAKAATDSSNLTKPNKKDQVRTGGSSDTSEGSENSGSFEDSERSDEEDSEDITSSEEGGSKTPLSVSVVDRSIGTDNPHLTWVTSLIMVHLTLRGQVRSSDISLDGSHDGYL
ncbi:retrovirus-related pol polyprotein from transposon TNT 1-94 [Tanacetum coccineum]